MEDEVDLELREDPLEDGPVEDRAGELARDETALLGIERLEVDREDGPRAVGGEARDEAVADLAAGPVMRTTGRLYATVTSLLR